MTLEIATMDGRRAVLGDADLADLHARVQGPLLRPGDRGWDESVLLWNGLISTRPALVFRPASTSDVAAAVRFAAAHRLLLGIKGGGHNIAGTAIAEAGLLLDMSGLRDVTVDPAARLARVGAGCLLGDVDRATQAHGLATVLGFVSEVGVAGLTLGGGLGYLTRRFGWTVDNLAEVEIVTADASVRIASPDENPDLFWALRGGGGNFGVVTRFTFRLHQVGPTVTGGLVAWPFERAAEILAAYRTLTARAPLELSVWMNLLRAPAAPFVPAEWRGRRVCAMAVCHSGSPRRAASALAPIRILGEPVFDVVRERPYVEVQSLLDDTEPKGLHYYWKTELAAELSDAFLATWRDLAAECPIPRAQMGILHLGGSLHGRAADDGAVGNRDARYAMGAIGIWDPSDPDGGKHRQWIRDAWRRFQKFSTGGNYINFQTADEGEERIRASYGPRFSRLVAIKQKLDPDNLFRTNRNVPPISAGG